MLLERVHQTVVVTSTAYTTGVRIKNDSKRRGVVLEFVSQFLANQTRLKLIGACDSPIT